MSQYYGSDKAEELLPALMSVDAEAAVYWDRDCAHPFQELERITEVLGVGLWTTQLGHSSIRVYIYDESVGSKELGCFAYFSASSQWRFYADSPSYDKVRCDPNP